ncbi:HEXOKINASE [Salix purpurea]|uniref:Phosphotransferase n=1 Tax=Salix purpurea TaxID=77065 RepID=A0A9Q0Q2G0_SALPP|nr:HEXOKINASE [Salix purpurea]
MRCSRKWARAMAILREFEENCGTPIGKLRQVADAMTVEMHAGLASEGGSKLKMLISYVDNLVLKYYYYSLINKKTFFIFYLVFISHLIYLCIFQYG